MPDVAAILEAIPGLETASVAGKLGGGEAGESWKLNTAEGKLVLRRDTPLARALDLDRESEWQILKAAHAAGLGPEPVYSDPGRGVLVTRFLPGQAWQAEQMRDPGRLEIVGRALRRVHDLPAVGRPFDPGAIARRYAGQVGTENAEIKAAAASELAVQLYPAAAPRCLCHHDPHAGNLVGEDPLRFIDWEYAAAGEPLFDLAVVIRYHALDKERAEILLRAWSGGADQQQLKRLRAHCRLYDLLAGLWQQVVAVHAKR